MVTRLDVELAAKGKTDVATLSLKSKPGETCVEAISEGEVAHSLQCGPTTTLTFAGKTTEFQAEFTAELESKKAWGIVQGE